MKKQQNVTRPPAGQPPAEAARPASKRKPRRSWSFWLLSRLFVLLLLLGAIAFFAPMLIGRGEFCKQLLAVVSPAIAKQIDITSLQLGWFSPIEIHGLVIKDAADQPLAEVPLIKSRKSLLAIALNYGDLGTFDVDQPKARIVLRKGGSNVEDFLAKLPKSK